MLKFSMLAEALSQERQEIQTREKAQAQVRISILYSYFLSFFLSVIWLILVFSSDAAENKKRIEIKDGKGNTTTANCNNAK